MERTHYSMLLDVAPPERREEVRQYIRWLLDNDEWFGIDETMLGFMEDYEHIAALVNARIHVTPAGAKPSPFTFLDLDRNYTVYDIGCSSALQHLFFGRAKGYVGVDHGNHPEPKFFLPNCRFVRGRFSEVVDTLGIGRDAIGIANMSILYDRDRVDELKAFDRVFERKVVL
jgi:hypothetical protein